MVRMDKPSPIQVGREFVRQYYTLLNKAPELLHRFYGVNSCYIHGGGYCNGEPEDGVIGQNEIHKKITSLCFKDCHTKVRQVDAHSSIAGGVVVQVIGELSNDRNPLRKFMQTFVLAPQGDNPFKFYVHNDIFRYADEVFPDEVSVVEEETADPEETYFTEDRPPANGAVDQQEPPREPSPSPEVDYQSPEPVEEVTSEPPRKESPPPQPVADPEPPALEDKQPVTTEAAPEKTETTPQAFSWAALASKNTPAQANAQQGTVVKATPRVEETDSRDRPPPRIQRQPRSTNQANPRPDRRDEERNVPDRGARRPVRYNDSQQIFVGNLPVDICEDDIREHFEHFGTITEVRINHSHANSPSFCFVIFADSKSAENVLREMPTNFKNNKRINIEEKKQRVPNRGDRDMRRGGGDNRRENPRGARNVYRR